MLACAPVTSALSKEDPDQGTRTPIKHVIVVIAENRSFDHVFGTYTPRHGQTISNLLSKGIVNADGTPGPNFALAQQFTVPAQPAYYIAAPTKSPYAILPPPDTAGPPTAPQATAPPFTTLAIAAIEPDLAPPDLVLLTTGASGLPRPKGACNFQPCLLDHGDIRNREGDLRHWDFKEVSCWLRLRARRPPPDFL